MAFIEFSFKKIKFEVINTIKFKYYLFLQKKDFKDIKMKLADIFY